MTKMTGLGKDYVKRIQQKLKENPLIERRVCGILIEITEPMSQKLDEFFREHSLPIEQLGVHGGEWTLSITPTSMGSIYVVKHSSGPELNITPFEWW